MPIVRFTHNLKRYYPELAPMEVSDTSIRSIIDTAEQRHPGLSSYILDERGNLRKHVQIFIGDNMIRDRENLSDEIHENDVIYIMQALSGG